MDNQIIKLIHTNNDYLECKWIIVDNIDKINKIDKIKKLYCEKYGKVQLWGLLRSIYKITKKSNEKRQYRQYIDK